MKLTVLTYNTLFAGRDGANDARCPGANSTLSTRCGPMCF